MQSQLLSRFILVSILFIGLACNQQEEKKTTESQPEESLTPPNDEKTACLLSEIAYCSDPQKSLEKYMPGWKLVWNSTSIGGNSAFVTTDGKTTAVAIRGSLIEFSWEAFQNWIYQDLNVTSLVDWADTQDSSRAAIAEGSSQGFENLKRLKDKQNGQTLFQYLDSATREETPLLLTGHSLGGNLATVYGSWLWQQFRKEGHDRKNLNVITFAAPAAGNESFAEDFDKKFPVSLRYENKNDIVPKFPCRSAISSLGDLFDSSLAANQIEVGYKDVTMPLNKVFGLLSSGMAILQFTNSKASYRQTNGKGKIISIPLSGKNVGHDISDWLSEAGYQHGVARYATQLGVPVVDCNP